MEHLQECASIQDLPQLALYPKISLSLDTEDYSLSPHRNKHPMIASSTSHYVLENVEFMQEKKLFAQFLSMKHQVDRAIIFQQMRVFYRELPAEQKNVQSRLGTTQARIQSEAEVLEYFVGMWLKDMGYGSTKNRKYLERMVRLQLGEVSVYKFFKIYKELKHLRLSDERRRHFLLQTCRNGWQFFISQIVDNYLHEKRDSSSITRI